MTLKRFQNESKIPDRFKTVAGTSTANERSFYRFMTLSYKSWKRNKILNNILCAEPEVRRQNLPCSGLVMENLDSFLPTNTQLPPPTMV